MEVHILVCLLARSNGPGNQRFVLILLSSINNLRGRNLVEEYEIRLKFIMAIQLGEVLKIL